MPAGAYGVMDGPMFHFRLEQESAGSVPLKFSGTYVAEFKTENRYERVAFVWLRRCLSRIHRGKLSLIADTGLSEKRICQCLYGFGAVDLYLHKNGIPKNKAARQGSFVFR